MRVVDKDRRAGTRADELEASGRSLQLFERCEDALRRLACGDAEPSGNQRVRSLERSGER